MNELNAEIKQLKLSFKLCAFNFYFTRLKLEVKDYALNVAVRVKSERYT